MPLVFQYGSNTDHKRLNSVERLGGTAEDLGRAWTINEFDVGFRVWSDSNGCAASDLIEAPGSGRHAWGVLYEVPADRIHRPARRGGQRTLSQIEGSRYEPRAIRVLNDAYKEIDATTYSVKPSERQRGLWTSAAYVGHIVTGLRQHGVPEDYVQHVIDVALQTNGNATDARAAASQKELLAALRRHETLS